MGLDHIDESKRPMVRDLKKLQDFNGKIQEAYKTGSPQWHWFETVDDMIHDQLTWLGD